MIETLHDYLDTRPKGASWDELLELVFGEPGEDETFGRLFLRRLLSTDPRFVESEHDGRWHLSPSNLLDCPLPEAPLVIVDLETTGQRSDRAGITEIGAVRLSGRREVARFETLVNPGASIPPYVARLTGISDTMVADAPAIESVLPEFVEFASDSVLVAHNAAFDVPLLDHEARRILGRPLGLPSLCTLKLARRLMPELQKASLDALAAHFGLAKASRHRALADAELTVAVLLRMLPKLEANGVRTVGGLLAAQNETDFSRRVTMKVSRRVLEALPEVPGVFWFSDPRGLTLFVGRTSDLRSEVLDYLLDADRLSRRQREMVAAVCDVGFRECASELEIAVVETEEVRRRRPSYNRGDRHLPRGFFVKVATRRSWPRVFVGSKISPDGALYLGPIRGRAFADDAAALLAKTFGLRTCPGRLDPGPEVEACWLADAQWCSSPCNGEITADAYRSRVRELERALVSGGGSLKEALGRRDECQGTRAGRDGAVLGRLVKIHRKRHWLVNCHHYVAAAPAAGGKLLVVVVLDGTCRAVFRPHTFEELAGSLSAVVAGRGKTTGRRVTAENADVSTILAHWSRRPGLSDEGVLFDLDPNRLAESLEAAAVELSPLLPVSS